MTVTLPFDLHADFATALPQLVEPAHGEEQPDPQVVVVNDELASQLGIDATWLRTRDGIDFLLGNASPADRPPQAMAYAGFQFGGLSPRLGDGRALLLGEVADERGTLHDLHAKGTGPTPFSRPGTDGRAGLGPMLREYLISEALHALGVPTARSLAVLTTGRRIQRRTVTPAAVVVRVASSHLRVGTVQYAAYQGGPQLVEAVGELCIGRHYPHVQGPGRFRDLFCAIVDAQCATVARWQRLGFIHGVMNTDNTTLSGQSIDFGPCAFMESYDPGTVYSSIDTQGRYAFGNQGPILGWNLARLAEVMLPLFDPDPDKAVAFAQEAMDGFAQRFADAADAELARGLGLDPADEASAKLVAGYTRALEAAGPDITLTNRSLADAAAGNPADLRAALGAAGDSRASGWVDAWLAQGPDADELARIHPMVIPRNRAVDKALTAAELDGDLEPFFRLLDAVTRPFAPVDEDAPGAEVLLRPDPQGLEGFRTFCGT